MSKLDFEEVKLIERLHIEVQKTAHLSCGICNKNKIKKEFKDIEELGKELYADGWRVAIDPVITSVCPMCSLNLELK